MCTDNSIALWHINCYRQWCTKLSWIMKGSFSMKYVLLGLCLFSLVSATELFYDDGTPQWINYGGAAVWFHLEDFFPPACSVELTEVEMWFYHNSSYPWDTSEFNLEIWSGNDETFLEDLLYQSVETAVHYSPVLIDVSQENIVAESDFWIYENTEFSAGGWPSAASDGSPPIIPHSYGNEGWIITGDLLFRCFADELSIESTSWGELKTIF